MTYKLLCNSVHNRKTVSRNRMKFLIKTFLHDFRKRIAVYFLCSRCRVVYDTLFRPRQLAMSKSMDFLFERSSLDSREKRPLLPLNVGQVGLIGGSGLINGYIDCENPHILKGRIIKEIKKSDNGDTISETHVNKMVFNVLTPQGFKSLA